MIAPARRPVNPRPFSWPGWRVGASPTGGAVFNVSVTRLSCDRRPAPARPDQHVRARDAASESGRPRLVSGRRRLAIAAHEAESEHRGNRGVGVGPELAQLTWGR